MARLEIEIGAVNDELKRILQDSKIALSQFQKEVGGSKLALGGLSQVSKETKAALEQQAIALSKSKTATQQARQASAELTLANRQNKGSVDAASGSYREAQQRLTALGRSIREAKGGFDSTNPSIRAQIAEYNKLNSKLKEFDRAMGNNYRNVGNYQGAFIGAIPILGQFTSVIGGVILAQQALSTSFSTNLRFDALEYSIRQVSTSAENFTENMNFLRDSSDRLGLDLMATTQSFKMWQGAAKFSNLTAKESRDIFESVANASAKMKLSSDDTQGAIRALSQMMSKGKIQAEELRGQLGERLPGAFSLAAQAMGVTEQELNKMMEKGMLVANEFLPKFAEQLDKSFGNDKTKKIESMQASVNRLSTEFDLLWRSENMTKFFTKALDGFALMANQINRMVNSKSWAEFKAIAFGSVEQHQRFVDNRDLTSGQRFLKGRAFNDQSLEQQKKTIEEIKGYLNTAVKAYNDFYKTSASDGMSVDQAGKRYKQLADNVKMYSDALSEANKKMSADGSLATKDPILSELTGDKKKGRSKTVKSIDEILPSLQGNDGNYYDQQLAKINSEYSKLVKTINESVGSKAKISQALGLAEAKRDFDTLKVSVDKFIDSTKGLKTQKAGVSLSGTLADPTQFSPTEWERLRLGGRTFTTKKEDKEQEDKFSKIIERSLRSGINDIIDDIGDLGSNFYEVFSNVFTKLTKPFQNIFSSIMSTQLSNLISGKMDDIDLFGLGNEKSKNIVGGLGALGGIISGVTKKTSVAGQVAGGALSGAAAGTAILPGWGTAIGAVVGAIGGLFTAKAGKRQEEQQKAILEEEKKQTALQQHMAALTFASSIVGMQTTQGIVSSVDRNEFGDITFRVEGRDLVASLNRESEAQKRGL